MGPRVGLMTRFKEERLIELGLIIISFRSFCRTFGYHDQEHITDLEQMEAVLIGAVTTAPRQLWKLNPVRQDALIDEAFSEWEQRGNESRRLYLQVFHTRMKYVRMTKATMSEAAKHYGSRIAVVERIQPQLGSVQ